MRIPASKVYRAFPELDRFSDAECKRLLVHVRAASAHYLLLLIALVVVFALSGRLTFAAIRATNDSLADALTNTVGQDKASVLLPLSQVLALCVVPTACALAARDRLLRALLRRAVRARVDRARCRRCRYLLLGQRVRDGQVVCPECGAATALARLRITEQDLVPPAG